MTGLRPYLYPAITAFGLIAFAIGSSTYPAVSAWSITFVLATSAGVVMWLRHRRISRWFAASVPWWVMANASGWFEFGAAMITLTGVIALAVGPTLPGRRRARSDAAPLPHLVNGPLVPVAARIHPIARQSRVLNVITILIFCAAIALGISAGAGVEPDVTGALALAALIMTVTFVFSIWFNGRVRVRIDDRGLHSRVFFEEQTILWSDVAGITLRYVFLPGASVRLVYYVVFSATNEFSFASSMQGAKELQSAIEAATGLTFPEPEITPTL